MSKSNLDTKNLLKEFWKYVGPDKKICYISLLLMFATLACELSRPFLLKKGLDFMATKDMHLLKNIAMLFLGILIIEYFSRSIFNCLISIALLKTINRVRIALFKHVMFLKMAYFDNKPVGGLLTRTVNDSEALGETLRAGVATILVDILTVVGMLIVMLTLDLPLSIVMMIIGVVVWLIVRWFGYKLRKQYLRVRSSLARSNAFMAEGINGAEIIQIFNYRQTSSEQFYDINRDYRQATIWRNVYDASLYAVVDGIAALVTAIVLYLAFGVRFGLVEISVLIVYLNLIERIFIPIRDLSGKFATIQQSLAALQRIFGLLFTPASIPQGEKYVESDEITIEFRNVSFSYREEGPMVLHDINFCMRPGQTIALVGMTGSGKSTTGKLLTRAYDGYQGKILINDVELSEINYHCLRSKIAVVHQEVEVFPGTIRDNITMFNQKISDDDIAQAIRMVKAEEIIAQLPGGLDHEVKEDGTNLSAGQLQLIVFARALAYNTPIILMDEATSNVDSVTEAWIQDALMQIFQYKTVIVVAHRLSTISAADNILVMKDGKIVQSGSHDQLAAQSQGYYAQLIRASQEEKTVL